MCVCVYVCVCVCVCVCVQDALPLVELATRVHKSHSSVTAPLYVLCDSGSGRAAVFIAVDILLSQYATENQVGLPTFDSFTISKLNLRL
jgi:protein tyrosine phosphatase